jgi:hypothetical protein
LWPESERNRELVVWERFAVNGDNQPSRVGGGAFGSSSSVLCSTSATSRWTMAGMEQHLWREAMVWGLDRRDWRQFVAAANLVAFVCRKVVENTCKPRGWLSKVRPSCDSEDAPERRESVLEVLALRGG